MEAIRVETTVSKDGTLRIPHLEAGEEVEVIVLRKPKTKPSRRLKQDWAGALRDYREQYSSIELQRKALEWRGD